MTIKELIAGRKSPEVPTHFGKGQVVSEKELRRPSFGIGFDLPAEPDYEALRDRQIAQSGRYEAFHSSGTGIFAEETAARSIFTWRKSRKRTAATSRRSRPPMWQSFT